MPKSNGFKSTGGRPPVTPKVAPSYSASELTAMSKLTTGPGGNQFVGDPNHVTLCKVCGRPISSAGPFDKPDDRYDYFSQVQHETHFTCASKAQEKILEREKMRLAAMDPTEREEAEAKLFNEGDTKDPRVTPLPRPDPYRFKPGEKPLDQVKKEGLPPNLPENLSKYEEETDPEVLAKIAAREEQTRREFEEYQRLMAEAIKEAEAQKKS